jgi:protein-S-isoprenylcysteine O-methyltransferase Ste14
VVVQFALMALILLAGFLPPHWPSGAAPLLAALGAMIALLAGIVAVWAWRTLAEYHAASAFPRPREGGRVVEKGPYEYLRHPIYAAGVLFFFGYALATSAAAFVPLAALALLWRNKALIEEEYLAASYADYREYRERVPGAFVPRAPRREG